MRITAIMVMVMMTMILVIEMVIVVVVMMMSMTMSVTVMTMCQQPPKWPASICFSRGLLLVLMRRLLLSMV